MGWFKKEPPAPAIYMTTGQFVEEKKKTVTFTFSTLKELKDGLDKLFPQQQDHWEGNGELFPRFDIIKAIRDDKGKLTFSVEREVEAYEEKMALDDVIKKKLLG